MSVAGLTPQVITETLHWLTQVRTPPADVSEVWVITSEEGKRRVTAALLHPRDGAFFRFCRDYRIDASKIRFSPEQILVVPGKDGRPLEDIRANEDNAALADFVLDVIRSQTSDSSRVLHCSVAGGRKTMGLYLGLALQLYGRVTDTLSHVLVNPPEVEGDPGFYYPPPKPGWLAIKGRKVHSRGITIELAQIPLLMLRGKLPSLEETGVSYTALVRRAQQDYALLAAPPPAVVESQAFTLAVAGHRVRLSPLETAVYVLFARARRDSCGRRGCGGCPRCTLAASDFLGEEGVGRLRRALRELGARDTRLEELRGWGATDPTDPEKRFREVRSRLNHKIQRSLGGGAWPALYAVAAQRLPGEDRVRYGIRLDSRLVTVR